MQNKQNVDKKKAFDLSSESFKNIDSSKSIKDSVRKRLKISIFSNGFMGDIFNDFLTLSFNTPI